MTATTEPGEPKPRVALAIATALGAGLLPKAPGTFGSLVGVLCVVALALASKSLLSLAGLALVVSLIGVWASDRVARHLQKKDPQIVVVDEVSGQLISYLGLATGGLWAFNWKYLLAGFLLFRLFDIWKPFPARLAESLTGGLGIMADDWVAGLYAAMLLALARHLGF